MREIDEDNAKFVAVTLSMLSKIVKESPGIMTPDGRHCLPWERVAGLSPEKVAAACRAMADIIESMTEQEAAE